MARTKALLVHVDQVDPAAYDGAWSGTLNGPSNDVIQMGDVLGAIHQGDPDYEAFYFPAVEFRATRDLFFEWLDWMAAELVSPGDTLVLHYSGHGGTIPNAVGGEPSRLNTLCFHDGMVLDAELADAWSRFRPGVLIVFVVDACHSGTVARFRKAAMRRRGRAYVRPPLVPRAVPRDVADTTYQNHQDFYDELQRQHSVAPATVATVLELAACTDDQESYEDPARRPSLGIFTETLATVLRAPSAPGSYRELHRRVREGVVFRAGQFQKQQEPVLLQVGAAMADLLDQRRPFNPV